MKAIIDWKRYDTDTAGVVAEWDNGRSSRDFHYYVETLYKTRNGNWFLHGKGGALSKYAESGGCHNTFEPGEGIFPLTEKEAATWMAERSPHLFDDYFAHLAADA